MSRSALPSGRRRLLLRAGAWALLLAAAGAVRFAALDSSPAGLWYDEALTGGNALSILAGERPVFFYPDGYPQEPLFFYLQAGALKLAGGDSPPKAWPLRAAAALAGLLTLPAFFLFARRLLPWNWAFLAAAVLAFHPWHVHFSRLGFRAILAPLMVSLLGWRLLGWTRFGGVRRAAEAGALLGLSLYTYTAANALVPAVALFLAMAWAGHPVRAKMSRGRYLAGVGAGVAAALIVFAPLGWHYLAGEGNAASRLIAVGPGAEGFSFADNLRGLGEFFFLRGDPVFKHGPIGRPLFPFVLGAFFLGGLAGALAEWRRRGSAWLFVLLAMAGFLAASLFSFQAPNKLRSLGAAPAVVLLFAQGVRMAFGAARRAGAPAWLARATVAGGLALWAFAEASAVLYGWHGSGAIYYEFNQQHAEAARWARGEPLREAPVRELGVPFWVPESFAGHAAVRYLTAGLPIEAAKPLRSLPDALEASRGRGSMYLLVTRFHPRNNEVLAGLGLPAKKIATLGPTRGQAFGWILRLDLRGLPAEGLSPEQRALAAEYFAAH